MPIFTLNRPTKSFSSSEIEFNSSCLKNFKHYRKEHQRLNKFCYRLTLETIPQVIWNFKRNKRKKKTKYILWNAICVTQKGRELLWMTIQNVYFNIPSVWAVVLAHEMLSKLCDNST